VEVLETLKFECNYQFNPVHLLDEDLLRTLAEIWWLCFGYLIYAGVWSMFVPEVSRFIDDCQLLSNLMISIYHNLG